MFSRRGLGDDQPNEEFDAEHTISLKISINVPGKMVIISPRFRSQIRVMLAITDGLLTSLERVGLTFERRVGMQKQIVHRNLFCILEFIELMQFSHGRPSGRTEYDAPQGPFS